MLGQGPLDPCVPAGRAGRRPSNGGRSVAETCVMFIWSTRRAARVCDSTLEGVTRVHCLALH
jgi:hypothetical protein